MNLSISALETVSPLDGRYRSKISALAEYFSESALIRYRVRMEVEYLLSLAETAGLDLRALSTEEKSFLSSLYTKEKIQVTKVKDFEATTNHDVKAVEYYIKSQLENSSLKDIQEWIHFALTSEDTNNVSYALMLSESLSELMLPILRELTNQIKELAFKHKDVALLARTHGQPASPTTLGKEFRNWQARLEIQIDQLSRIQILAKLNGATGNYNAHLIAYPNIDWLSFSEKFISRLNESLKIKLAPNLFTTQIEPHDTYAEIFDIMRRINTILIDFNQDIWRYISDGWIIQKTKEGEVGSSTMPHKVNPIDFENSEGNLGIANALFTHFSAKLPISRLQRDLSDSTVLRNIGTAFGHSILAYKSTLQGLSKVDVNLAQIQTDLEEHPELIAEAIQTILRVEGVAVPYEQLKELTRGKKVSLADFKEFIEVLSVSNEVKARLSSIIPSNYLGIAGHLAQSLQVC